MYIRRRLYKVGLFAAVTVFVVMRWKLAITYRNQIRHEHPATHNSLFITQEQRNRAGARPTGITDRHHDTESVKDKDHVACTPARAIVYLKTHKTGSTTLMEIFKRHADTHELTGRVQGFTIPFYGGYPGSLRKEFCFLDSHNTSRNFQKKASVLMGHFRFHEQNVKELMSPNARYISIMRNPLKASQSSFHFYYTRQCLTRPPFFAKNVGCSGFPYIHALGKVGMNFSEFLSEVSPSKILESPWGFRAKNFQAHDFGLDPYNESVEYVLAEAKKLDKTFDLILILEHLLESLILLKDMLCMEWSDLVPVLYTGGRYIPLQLSARERSKINQLTTQDRILYNYFNESLWNKIEKYGRERMKKDVEKLKRLDRMKGEKPIHSIEVGCGSKKAKVTFEASADKESRLSDLANRLKEKYPRSRIATVEDKQFFYKLADHMIANNAWCPRVLGTTKP